MTHKLIPLASLLAIGTGVLNVSGGTVDTYCPLHDGDVLNYRIPAGTILPAGDCQITVQSTTFGGRAVFAVGNSLYPTDKSYFAYSGEQLLEYGASSSGTSHTYNPPFIDLDGSKLIAGGSWSSTVPVTESGATFDETLTCTATPVGTVTVPAGTFQNCVQVSGRLSIAGLMDDPLTSIFAPGVGRIRWAIYWGETIQGWQELTSGTIGGVPIGSDSGTPPTITTSSPLPAGKVGATYSQTLAATGGAAPYTWAQVSGSLPAGLTFTTNGTISGIPSAGTTANFRVRVTDALGKFSENGFVLTVNGWPAGTWQATALYGNLYNNGNGWYDSPTFGWMWFTPDWSWSYSSKLNGWLGRSGTSTALWSPQFRWLTVSGKDDGTVYTSTMGWVWVGDNGWVNNARFGWIWANGDGVWFWSTTSGWLGVTPEGAIWCVNQNKFL